MSLKNILSGTGVAIITPFAKDGSIDFPALGKVIDFIIEGGINYIVSLGTTGETPVLDVEEKKAILNYTFDKVNNRVPIVVGVGGNNTQAVIAEMQQLPLEKAVAILSASPNYNKPSQDGIFLHYKTIAEKAPKPIILYNVPGRTGRNVSATTITKLAHEVENIIGIKEATDNMQQCMEILRDRPKDFLIVSGDDALSCSQIALGMDGVISVAANCFPTQFSTMVNLARENKFEAARAIHYKLLKGYDLLFAENNPAGVKAFLFEQGLIQNELRLPLTPVSEGLHQQIKIYLQNLS
ncbi:MAG: 4-hydroxy-tetrahydrodipicolinate synthase [Chitinophagaceae bacterium]|nr:4-hydroxy-tetrahydrodipicolinate synthase [Chitinophagaceae bacterium]